MSFNILFCKVKVKFNLKIFGAIFEIKLDVLQQNSNKMSIRTNFHSKIETVFTQHQGVAKFL